MAQGKKKKGVYGEGCFDFCMGKGVDCVIRGERNLCTMLGGLGFTGLFFLGYFRATGRPSGQIEGTEGGRSNMQLAQLALLLLSTRDGCVL